MSPQNPAVPFPGMLYRLYCTCGHGLGRRQARSHKQVQATGDSPGCLSLAAPTGLTEQYRHLLASTVNTEQSRCWAWLWREEKDFGVVGLLPHCAAALPQEAFGHGTADLRVQSLHVPKITTWWASGKKGHHPQTGREGPANSNKGQFSALKTEHLTQQGNTRAPHP